MNFIPDIVIRQEEEKDYDEVLNLVRDCFYNMYMPGCNEHYLVHKLRQHEDFMPELTFVATCNDEIVGYIAASKGFIEMEDASKPKVPIVTLAPLCTSSKHRGMKVGEMLIQKLFDSAKALGHKIMVVQGYPTYYSKYGFKYSKEFDVWSSVKENGEKSFPVGLQIVELEPGALNGISGRNVESEVFEHLPDEEVDEFDKKFPDKLKCKAKSQEMFGMVIQMQVGDKFPAGFDPKLCNDVTPIQ